MSTRTEKDVGITEYISDHEGFRGIIKVRYQDFLVNEIDWKNNIVRLTNLECEPEPEKTVVTKSYSHVLNEEEKEKLSNLLTQKEGESFHLKTGMLSKEERAEIHHAVREMFPELDSKTETNAKTGETTVIVVKKSFKNRSRAAHQSKKRFCKFVMYKENIGTMSAINVVGKRLHIKNVKSFQYAGTKDKRAITVQEITSPMAHERLKKMANLDSNIVLGNFSYCDNPLHLGDLNGNHFSLIIRNVDGDKVQIETGMNSFKTIGFINYFGMQRFGTTNIATYKIGIEILKNNWKNVIDLILNTDDMDKDSDLVEAINEYKSDGDAERALIFTKDSSSIEARVLKGIAIHGEKQLIQAFGVLSRNIRQIYLHSYQSYVWNRAVSKRIKKYGLNPIVGDLVFSETYTKYLKPNDSEPPCKKLRPEVQNGEKTEEKYRSNKRSLQDVKMLTEDDDLTLFQFKDVVFPLPGHSVKYPCYKEDNIYRDIMQSDDIDFERGMIHKVSDYSMTGAYRHVVVCPKNVTYEEMRYNSCKEPLLQTDRDIMKGLPPPRGEENGKFRALKIEFSLPTSSYATVALREVLKADLSVPAQNELTNAHIKECMDVENTL